MSTTVPVARGCGKRQQGGIYMECGMSPYGMPVEHFLLDPPVPTDAALNLATQGIDWVERDGTWHVIDWVGQSHYPNVADFVEEVRRFGLSRRIPKNEDFSRLTTASRIILVHARAILVPATFKRYRPSDDAPFTCPKRVLFKEGQKVPPFIKEHESGAPHLCAGVWWEDVKGGDPDKSVGGEVDSRFIIRTMPSFRYGARTAPLDVTPEYTAGMFASFPISNLAVVRAADGSHVEAAAKASRANIPIEEVQE